MASYPNSYLVANKNLMKFQDRQLSLACSWAGGCMGGNSISRLRRLVINAQTLMTTEVQFNSRAYFLHYRKK